LDHIVLSRIATMNRLLLITTSISLALAVQSSFGESPSAPPLHPSYRNIFQPVESTPPPRALTAIPPLQRYPISALTLTAIIVNAQGERFASVENPEGIGYKVERGTVIGKEGARVVEITSRGMVVKEGDSERSKGREILLRGEE
jgi:Tfp pilus assembly protein PilP